jgi:hypothetical protein
MNDSIMSFIPLIFMMAFFFIINRWVGKKCNVWTSKEVIISLIPFFNYFGVLLIFMTSIDRLNKRVEELEVNQRVN